MTLPFIVQIRPSINGVPDPFTVLASFVLSHDNDPLVVSYEFATTNFTLAAGTYFALFAPQGSDAGFLLGSASDPFMYQAGMVTLGFLDPSTGQSSIGQVPAAVRILGVAITPGPVLSRECLEDCVEELRDCVDSCQRGGPRLHSSVHFEIQGVYRRVPTLARRSVSQVEVTSLAALTPQAAAAPTGVHQRRKLGRWLPDSKREILYARQYGLI